MAGPAVLGIALLGTGKPAGATNHLVHFRQVMAGANGDARIQFLQLEMEFGGQNLWFKQFGGEADARAMLVFFDTAGNEIGEFKFTANPPGGGNLQVLIATREFKDLAGAPDPDVLLPRPMLNPISGKVCFKNNPANTAFVVNQCLSYGSFTGATETSEDGLAFGPPAPALPIVNTVSLRRTAANGSDVDNANFAAVTAPNPTNNAGATVTIPVKTQVQQGDTLFNLETFLGNGRTCGRCHVSSLAFRLPPDRIKTRFNALSNTNFDPLFVAELAPSAFDGGFDFNLNTLVLTAAPGPAAPACTGELRGLITSTVVGSRALVHARTSETTYQVYGGMSPTLSGTVSDSFGCAATVASMTAGGLNALEDPSRMRKTSADARFPDGRGLILENIDGFSNAPVFRKSPHLLNLSRSAPFGLSGDIPDLQTFAAGAVRQHLTRTLGRSDTSATPDFRLPTTDEKAALQAFLSSLESPAGTDPDKFDLARFAATAAQRRGRALFFGSAKCSQCHGGTVLAKTTVSIQGKPIGVNASFNTGVVNQPINGVAFDNLPCEPAPGVGACGSREFSTPQLFNLKNLGPFFHDASAPTVREAVAFYSSGAFSSSPSGTAIGGILMSVSDLDDITAFLEGLVVRPYSWTAGPIAFGTQETAAGPTAAMTLTLTNTSSAPVTFTNAPNECALTGADPGEFQVVSCPLGTPLAVAESRDIQVRFDPTSGGAKRAILEIRATDPSGVDLTGTGINSTTTMLASSLNPSVFGQSVTFTATVTSSAGTPPGNVTFKDRAKTLGTGTLASGQATLSTAALAGGTHDITAEYGGPTAFASSTSAVLTQTVNPTTTATAWTPVNVGVPTYQATTGTAFVPVRALAVHPTTPATAYAGIDGGIGVPGGILKSTDGGATWKQREPRGGIVNTLVIDPVSPSTVYAGTYGNGVWKTTDGGVTWYDPNTGLTDFRILSLAIDPLATSTVYAGTQGGGIFKTTNGGVSWTPINAGLTTLDVRALAVDPASPAIYAGTFGGGVWKSTTGGLSWAFVNTFLSNLNILALAVERGTPNTVYAATSGQGIFKTSDGGTSWRSLSNGLTTFNVRALAVDPATPGTVYAGTYGGGVFLTTSGGSVWTQHGLGGLIVNSLAFTPSGPPRLYAGTQSEGIFVREAPPAGFDGDGKADIAVFRRQTMEWFIRNSSDGSSIQIQWGDLFGFDIPAAADYDGDGKTDVAVARRTSSGEIQWLIRRSSDAGLTQLSLGSPDVGGFVYVPSDYDGDGKADIALYHTAGVWHIRRSTDGALTTALWGSSAATDSDFPVPADYDGDGKADIAVYRRGTGEWLIRRSSDGGLTSVTWGAAAFSPPYHVDVPVPGDYDGSGRAQIAVYRRTEGEWFIRRSADGGLDYRPWGSSYWRDEPVSADYDGDGKADVAVYRSSPWGEWFIRRSSDGGFTYQPWGQGGDSPVLSR